jgi:hypothetical protein
MAGRPATLVEPSGPRCKKDDAMARRSRNPFLEAVELVLTVARRGRFRVALKTSVRRSRSLIVGPEVPDQRRLRPPRPVEDLAEFVEFLARLEEMFGPMKRRRTITRGGRFLL